MSMVSSVTDWIKEHPALATTFVVTAGAALVVTAPLWAPLLLPAAAASLVVAGAGAITGAVVGAAAAIGLPPVAVGIASSVACVTALTTGISTVAGVSKAVMKDRRCSSEALANVDKIEGVALIGASLLNPTRWASGKVAGMVAADGVVTGNAALSAAFGAIKDLNLKQLTLSAATYTSSALQKVSTALVSRIAVKQSAIELLATPEQTVAGISSVAQSGLGFADIVKSKMSAVSSAIGDHIVEAHVNALSAMVKVGGQVMHALGFSGRPAPGQTPARMAQALESREPTSGSSTYMGFATSAGGSAQKLIKVVAIGTAKNVAVPLSGRLSEQTPTSGPTVTPPPHLQNAKPVRTC